jgi:hypothetical protein
MASATTTTVPAAAATDAPVGRGRSQSEPSPVLFIRRRAQINSQPIMVLAAEVTRETIHPPIQLSINPTFPVGRGPGSPFLPSIFPTNQQSKIKILKSAHSLSIAARPPCSPFPPVQNPVTPGSFLLLSLPPVQSSPDAISVTLYASLITLLHPASTQSKDYEIPGAPVALCYGILRFRSVNNAQLRISENAHPITQYNEIAPASFMLQSVHSHGPRTPRSPCAPVQNPVGPNFAFCLLPSTFPRAGCLRLNLYLSRGLTHINPENPRQIPGQSSLLRANTGQRAFFPFLQPNTGYSKSRRRSHGTLINYILSTAPVRSHGLARSRSHALTLSPLPPDLRALRVLLFKIQ